MVRDIKYWVVVPAAGSGQRMQSKIPKQYIKINHQTIIEHTISLFTTQPQVEKVVVVLHPDDQKWSTLNIKDPKKVITTIGGKTRAQSVINGLQHLQEEAAVNDWVLVHDAVRPCLPKTRLEYFINTVADHRIGGLLAVPIRDTIKQVDADHAVRATVSREGLWMAQTPQMFRYGFLLSAMEDATQLNIPLTDESCAIEWVGEHPLVILGDWRNIKITTPDDLARAKEYLEKI